MIQFKIISKELEVEVTNFGTNAINNILSRRGPRVEPWGTPQSAEKDEEYVPNTRREEFLEDK
jgi:hypothetical protein